MKRKLLGIVATMAALSVLLVTAMAGSTAGTVENGTLTIAGSGPMEEFAQAADSSWYAQRTDIQAIRVEEGVTTVGSHAFGDSAAIKADIGPDVTAVGAGAFAGCVGLNTITFRGDAPTFAADSFTGVTAAVNYYADRTGWTEEVRQNYSGTLTWNAITVASLELIDPPSGEYLAKRDTLDWQNTQLKITYSDQTTKTIPVTEDMVSGFDNTQPGDQTVTVRYGGQTAQCQVSVVLATVQFQDHDGRVLKTLNLAYGDSVTAPEAPVREADNARKYEFKGWDKPVAPTCQGDAVYKAEYTATYIDYTISFVDWNENVLQSDTYQWGAEVTPPADPERAADNEHTYTFKGWDKEVVPCAGSTTYKATYESSVRMYTVTFLNADGTTFATKSFAWNAQVTAPEGTPVKAQDNENTYKFTGWGELGKCTGDAKFTAQFKAVPREYTVKFLNWDKTPVIEAQTLQWGEDVVIPEDPTRPADEENTYTFTGWSEEPSKTCQGDATYIAQYTSGARTYTVTFLNADGTTFATKTFAYGAQITAPEGTPVKAQDNKNTYKFTGWGELDKCTGDAKFTAHFQAVPREYTVKFLNWDDTPVIEAQTLQWGDPVVIPEDPTRPADEKNTYTFTGWSEEPSKTCQGDATYVAQYTSGARTYTVTFLNADGTTFATKSFAYGAQITAPEGTPVKAQDNENTYKFTGWGELGKCTGDAKFTAHFQAVARDYTVKFLNWDDTPVIEAQTLQWGDSVVIPENPTRPDDEKGSYTFKGWSEEPSATCQGSKTYRAVYELTANVYTVRFLNWNGDVLSTAEYEYGQTVLVPENPTRPSDNACDYTFKAWDKPVAEKCQGSVDYKATYTEKFIDYTITFVNWDNQPVATEKYHWDQQIVAPKEIPTRPQNNTYTYTFAGWGELGKCQGNATIQAQYTPVYREYTVTFQNHDGTPFATQTYHWDQQIVAPEEIPTKAQDNVNTYEFKGWGELGKCQGDAAFKAEFTAVPREYTVTFKNHDGTPFATQTYHWDQQIVAPKEIPVKAQDNIHRYEFKGWGELGKCQGDAVFTAEFTPIYREYTVEFRNWDNHVIEKQTYHWDEKIVAPETVPTKAKDNTYTYEFKGWGDLGTCQGNAIYKAEFTPVFREYTITFEDWNGDVLQSKTYHWGADVTPPETPSREADKTYTYTFHSWGKDVVDCAGAATYTAVYDEHFINYTVDFVDWNGDLIESQIHHYNQKVTPPEDPVREADNTYTYEFKQWDKEVVNCTGNTTYKAVYTPTYIDYTVVFADENGHELSRNTYHWGDPLKVPKAPPKAADKTYTYEFKGWGGDVSKCQGSKTYTAQYTPVYIEYNVAFLDWDNSVVDERFYHYGDEIQIPEGPYRLGNEVYKYEFRDWRSTTSSNVEVDEICHGDATYVATYNRSFVEYIIRFLDWDDTVLQSKTYHYGDKVKAPADPKREADETYTYKFTGWDKRIADCSESTDYRAQYKGTYINYTVEFQNWDGTTLQKGTYHYGDKVTPPKDPTREGDEATTYIFAGWGVDDPTVCRGNAVLKAQFTTADTEYTVEFKDWDGKTLQKRTDYHWGDEVKAPKAPARKADKTYTYEFAGWGKEVGPCRGDTVYTAQYKESYIDYTVEFRNWDNSLIEKKTFHYGDQIVAPETVPTKPADDSNRYRFKDWGKPLGECRGNAVFTARFEAVGIDYIVTFKNWDGTVIEEKSFAWGEKITAPAKTPEKQADNTYTYTFKGWDKPLGKCQGDAEFTAQFDAHYIDYTVKFLNHDGHLIEAQTYHYGDKIVPPEEIPAKNKDNTYTYQFQGWGELGECTGNAEYTAKFKPVYIEYTIQFLNHDGSEVARRKFHYGDQITAPETTPKRESDETYTYTFRGWDRTLGICRGDDSYTAQYNRSYIEYTVRFLNWDGTELSRGRYHWGDQVQQPTQDPVRESDNTYNYQFKGWDREVVRCEGDTDYTAAYDKEYILYTIRFRDWNGDELQNKKYHWGQEVTPPANPKRPADEFCTYRFKGWDPKVVPCQGGATYEAVYEPTHIEPVSPNTRVDMNLGSPVLSWRNIPAAEAYEVYRATSASGSYSRIWRGEETTFTDSDTTPGHTYYYKVRAVAGDVRSSFGNPVHILCRCGKPVVTGSNRYSDGKPVVTWKSVKGADSYEVYRSTSKDSGYQLIFTTTGTRMTNGSAKLGHTYYYRVRALCNGSDGASSFYSDTIRIRCEKQSLQAPEIKLSNNSSTGKIYVSWTAVSGAQKYEVWRSVGDKDHYQKFYTTTGTHVTNSSAQAGIPYYYKVRAMADGDYGPFSSGKYRTCDCARPDLTAVNRAGDGLPSLSWKSVEGAKSYEVYRAQSGGDFTRISTVTATSYTDTAAEKGVTYTYKVRALCAKSSAGNSAYSYTRTVRSGDIPIGVPTASITSKTSTGKPYLTWTEVEGAEKYEVWRAVGKNGTYSRLFTTEGTRMTNGSAKVGTTYYYKVRAIVDGREGPFSAAKSRTCDCARPTLNATLRSDGSPVLTWNKVDGASKYEVWYKVSGESGYRKLYTTTGSKLTHGSAKDGVTYVYRVRAICAKASSGNSAYSYTRTITAGK